LPKGADTGSGRNGPAALHRQVTSGGNRKNEQVFTGHRYGAVTICSSQHTDFAIDLNTALQGTLARPATGSRRARQRRRLSSRHRDRNSRESDRATSACDCESRHDWWDGQGGIPAASWGLGRRGRITRTRTRTTCYSARCEATRCTGPHDDYRHGRSPMRASANDRVLRKANGGHDDRRPNNCT